MAETLQPDTQIAVDLTRESIDGRVYIVGTVDTVTIKVLSRVDYIATISRTIGGLNGKEYTAH